MVFYRRRFLLNAFKLFDMGIMTLSFVLTTLAVSHQVSAISIGYFLSMSIKVQSIIIFFCLLLVWHICFSINGLYRSRRFSVRLKEAIDISKATALGTLGLFVTALWLNIEAVTWIFLGVFWAVSTFIAIVSRLMLRWSLAKIRSWGRNLRFGVIVGTNPRAVQLARIIEKMPELGYRLLGFVDEPWNGIEEFRKAGYPLVSDFDRFPSFARDHPLDEVWISFPIDSFPKKVSQVVVLCRKLGIITRFFSNNFGPNRANWATEQFDGASVITQPSTAVTGWPGLTKRAIDICLSLILLIILSPLFLLVALLIKIMSPGRVFFVQERVGYNRRRFPLYKFRTMVPDAEQKLSDLEHLNEVTGPVFKIKHDPRITRIGAFLRKTSIDELPQLFNVVMGHMSLVGPRPLPARDYKGFYEDWHRRRFSVLPGITCLWQAQGRSSIPFEKWMEYDLEYIDQWSLWLDFKILLKSIPAVLRGSGSA